jgi:DNA polymerase I-like protein with 3'-5' exonuclease and polymerase domains
MNYPDLKDSKIISFDVETYDPELKTRGPGVYRRDGNILGMGIANEQGYAEYYDIAHPGCDQYLKNKNKAYLKDVLAIDCKKIGTNILYDLDWTENWWEVPVKGELHDIQVAEPLLDENRRQLGLSHPYSLDSLAEKYLNKKKQKNEIDAFCLKNNLKEDSRKWLWKMPASLVRKYGIADVKLPLEIFRHQWAMMSKQDLLTLYHMEMGLHRLLLQMRKVGVPTSKEKIDKGIEKLYYLIKEGKHNLKSKYGEFNYNSGRQIAPVMDKLGIRYPLTEKGNPNLDKKVLGKMATSGVQLAVDILNLRTADKTLKTFFINSFHNYSILGRIHCSFFPLSSDEYGTKSGRFSGAHPNLQQIPSEEPYGKICRSVFIPEEGHLWGKLDYSQIEYRFIAHYAIGSKADEVRARYNNDPSTDYHKMIMEWTGLNRKKAKVLNFGTSYFMGAKTISETFGWSLDEAKELLAMYFEEVPFVKETRSHVVNVGKDRGYIKTILGRRARITERMRIERKEHSLFNRLIQGSAADLLKKAMYDAYNAGIFNVLIPHLTVHDELDVSVPNNKEGFEALDELANIMEKAIELKVPVKVDVEIGESWGELKDYERR